MDRHSQPISTWWAEWKVWCSHHLVNILKSCWFFYFMPNNSFPRISSRCVLIRWGKAGTGLAQLCRPALTPLGIGPDQRFLTIFSDSMVIHNFYVLSTTHMNKTFSARSSLNETVLNRLWRWGIFMTMRWQCPFKNISFFLDAFPLSITRCTYLLLWCYRDRHTPSWHNLPTPQYNKLLQQDIF